MTKNPDTTRRLGPSAWRDDWMRPSQTRTQAAREDTMDTPEPARDDLDAFIDERTAADPAFAHHLAAADAAARASQAAQGPDSPGGDAGAAHAPHGGSAGRTGLDAEFRDLLAEALTKPLPCPKCGRLQRCRCHVTAGERAYQRTNALTAVVRDVVIPTIREQAFATARAEIAKLRDDQTFDDELSATARVAYTVALNWIDRITRGGQ